VEIKMKKIMKNIVLILIMIVTVHQQASAQLITLPTEQPIEISSINLKNSANSKKVFYGESAEKLVQAFGAPDSANPFFFEMDSLVGTEYKYDNNEFYFANNELYIFNIKESNIHVGKNGTYIKVGDSINVLNTFYPNYKVQNNLVRTKLKVSDTLIDASLVFKTNGSIITEIIMFIE